MNKIVLALIATALTFSQTTVAATTANLDLYHRLIDAQRSPSGKLVQIVLKPNPAMNPTNSTGKENNPADIVVILRDRLEKMKNSSSFSQVKIQTLTKSGWTRDEIQHYNDAKNILSATEDVQRVLSDKVISEILREFQKDLNMIFQFNVLAKPGAPGYYHDRALIDMALKKAMSMAEDALGTVPALRAVSFLLNLALGWVEEKRSYAQNILLFYIEKMPASALGFTAQEVSFIKSSIFERQIALWDLEKLAAAKKNWARYGTEQFEKQMDTNSKRLAKYGANHGEILPSVNFAFTPATKNNVSYILNTQDRKSKTSKDLSTAYNGSAPHRIREFRIELQLTQLASNLLPLPNFALDQLNDLLESYYSKQKLTEGALYAYLLSQGKTKQARIVLEQSINPILIHDFK